jgi:hypothetical protein
MLSSLHSLRSRVVVSRGYPGTTPKAPSAYAILVINRGAQFRKLRNGLAKYAAQPGQLTNYENNPFCNLCDVQ